MHNYDWVSNKQKSSIKTKPLSKGKGPVAGCVNSAALFVLLRNYHWGVHEKKSRLYKLRCTYALSRGEGPGTQPPLRHYSWGVDFSKALYIDLDVLNILGQCLVRIFDRVKALSTPPAVCVCMCVYSTAMTCEDFVF